MRHASLRGQGRARRRRACGGLRGERRFAFAQATKPPLRGSLRCSPSRAAAQLALIAAAPLGPCASELEQCSPTSPARAALLGGSEACANANRRSPRKPPHARRRRAPDFVLRRTKNWKPGDCHQTLAQPARKVRPRTPRRHADVEAVVRGGGRLRSRRAAQGTPKGRLRRRPPPRTAASTSRQTQRRQRTLRANPQRPCSPTRTIFSVFVPPDLPIGSPIVSAIRSPFSTIPASSSRCSASSSSASRSTA